MSSREARLKKYDAIYKRLIAFKVAEQNERKAAGTIADESIHWVWSGAQSSDVIAFFIVWLFENDAENVDRFLNAPRVELESYMLENKAKYYGKYGELQCSENKL